MSFTKVEDEISFIIKSLTPINTSIIEKKKKKRWTESPSPIGSGPTPSRDPHTRVVVVTDT